MHNSFGEALRQWRGQRRMSQLDLGLTANVSARHISFLETGRARPSQSMAMQLCETLEVPHAARNAFLGAAGFATAYRRRELSDGDMAHVRAAVELDPGASRPVSGIRAGQALERGQGECVGHFPAWRYRSCRGGQSARRHDGYGSDVISTRKLAGGPAAHGGAVAH